MTQRRQDLDWFVFNADSGEIGNIGPQLDFDAADAAAPEAAWIITPEMAAQWLSELQSGNVEVEP